MATNVYCAQFNNNNIGIVWYSILFIQYKCTEGN